jgi:hypothetical protein
MYLEYVTQRTRYEQTIFKKAQAVHEWVRETLDSTEGYSVVSTHNGLGLRVAIHSIRAKNLLKQLHRDLFSGFVEPRLSLDEQGVWTAWFGYSEPIEGSPHYVSLQ